MFLVESAPAAARFNIASSGASFPFQIYSLWFMLINRENKDMKVDYIAKDSGAVIKDFQNHAVDFAASDAATND